MAHPYWAALSVFTFAACSSNGVEVADPDTKEPQAVLMAAVGPTPVACGGQCGGISLAPGQACCQGGTPTPYDVEKQCCTSGGIQQKYPIQNIDACLATLARHKDPTRDGCSVLQALFWTKRIRWIPGLHLSGAALTRFVNRWTAEFFDICNGHDECYQSCENALPKVKCDSEFAKGMNQYCMGRYAHNPVGLVECELAASAFYEAVHLFATSAWEDDKREYCECCQAKCSCTPAPSDIVAWWPGDGNPNDIVGGNNGIPLGGTSFGPGEVGQAFTFDGIDGRISVSSSADLRFGTGDVTVEAWIKSPPGSGVQAFIGKEQQEYPYAVILFRLENGIVAFAVSDCGTGGCGFGDSRGTVFSPFRIDDNQFHHVAGVRISTGYQLYVDGALVATRLEAARNADHDEPLYLGDQWLQPQWPYNGTLDEVTLYRRALTAAEIKAIYEAGGAGKCK